MENRKKIGLLFNFNPGWMGGVVYLINLVKTLNYLPDNEKPELLVFYRPELERFLNEMNYPHIKFIKWTFPSIYKAYLNSWITGKNKFVIDIINQYQPEVLYPVMDFPVRSKTPTRLFAWYADLQHMHYPEFFSRRKIMERNARIKLMLRKSENLILSSKSVEEDFRRFFRVAQNLRISLYRFVSVPDQPNDALLSSLLEKYRIPTEYFIVCNQFHKHKNHKLVIESIAQLKKRGKEVHIVMTGKYPDPAHSDYMKNIFDIIYVNNIGSNVHLLGVIPRMEQLILMKHSQAVIQPSLFEGWSTVIEDAISLGVPVIASSIPVNHEQLGNEGAFFNPGDPDSLALILSHYYHEKKPVNQNYTDRIAKAAKTFMEIIEND